MNWGELVRMFIAAALGGYCGGYLFHRFNRRGLELRAVVALERIARASPAG